MGSVEKTMNYNLKRIREETGISQSQLADQCEMSVRTLQHYEQGNKDINKAAAETLYRIAKVLNCKIVDLLELDRIGQ